MSDYKYVYGPVPSRRLGLSLGISPIPKKTCNYSCIYCQLGRTDHLTNKRKMFFPIDAIMAEFEDILKTNTLFDVITIVGEGEPTLYSGLGELISEIQKRTDRPVAVITNGALLFDPGVQRELENADILLPSMDAYDEASFQTINRPYGKLSFSQVYGGLKAYADLYRGQLWLEIMLIDEINDDELALANYLELLQDIKYDKLYLNTPVRPPAELTAGCISPEKMSRFAQVLNGISIDMLTSEGFRSQIEDHYGAILSIIRRHPMNQFELESFLVTRGCRDIDSIMDSLNRDNTVIPINYKGYITYRLK